MKQNMIIKAAVAALFGAMGISAHAGVANGIPVSTATGAVVSNATFLGTGSVTYSTQSPVALGTVFAFVQLSGGAKFIQTAGSTISAGALVAANTGTATVTPGNGVVSTDQTFAVFPLVVTATAAPVNTTLTFQALAATTTGGGVTNAGFLSTAGGALAVTTSIGSATSSTTVSANVDTAASGNAIVSVVGVTPLVLQSGASNFATTGASGMTGAAVETKQINVTSGTGVALTTGATSNTGTSTTLINFGGFKFTDNAAAKGADGVTTFSMANNYTGTYGAVVTGNFGAAIGTGGSVFVSASNSCGTTVATGTINTGATTATFSGVTAPATAVATYLCMQVNTPSNAVSIPATTPTIVVTQAGTSATTAAAVASGTLYALANNGAVTDVRTYVPVAAAGYTSFIRIINTGVVSAAINGAVIDAATGVVGTAGVLVSSLPAGAATTLTSSQVEAVVGAIAGASRPRIRITANTTLSVQSFILTNANGNYSVSHGAD